MNANDLSTASTELQSQLAELDACIAQLTSSITVPDAQKSDVVMRHKRTYSTEIDRQLDPSVPINGTT